VSIYVFDIIRVYYSMVWSVVYQEWISCTAILWCNITTQSMFLLQVG